MFKVCKLSEIPEAKSWQERVKSAKGRPRVFHTYLHNLREGDSAERVLVTTTKDLHLAFGRLSRFEQTMFGEFLDALMEQHKTPQLVVALDDNMDRVLVSRVGHDAVVTYTLSPA